jgi:hypothetical protein
VTQAGKKRRDRAAPRQQSWGFRGEGARSSLARAGVLAPGTLVCRGLRAVASEYLTCRGLCICQEGGGDGAEAQPTAIDQRRERTRLTHVMPRLLDTRG